MSERSPDRPVVCPACGMDLSEHELGAACPGCGGIARTYKTESKAEVADNEVRPD